MSIRRRIVRTPQVIGQEEETNIRPTIFGPHEIEGSFYEGADPEVDGVDPVLPSAVDTMEEINPEEKIGSRLLRKLPFTRSPSYAGRQIVIPPGSQDTLVMEMRGDDELSLVMTVQIQQTTRPQSGIFLTNGVSSGTAKVQWGAGASGYETRVDIWPGSKFTIVGSFIRIFADNPDPVNTITVLASLGYFPDTNAEAYVTFFQQSPALATTNLVIPVFAKEVSIARMTQGINLVGTVPPAINIAFYDDLNNAFRSWNLAAGAPDLDRIPIPKNVTQIRYQTPGAAQNVSFRFKLAL